MKRTIFIFFISIISLLIIMIIATGCSNRYPNVRIDTHAIKSGVEIDIGSRYEYVDFDVVTTDSGKDVVIHFVLEEEK